MAGKPGEYKTVQARIVVYVQEAGPDVRSNQKLEISVESQKRAP